jgi:hypothetical protein
MFMVLAIGTLVDTSQPAYSMEAEKYNQLGRAALFQTAFFESPTVNAVQALVSHQLVRFALLILMTRST